MRTIAGAVCHDEARKTGKPRGAERSGARAATFFKLLKTVSHKMALLESVRGVYLCVYEKYHHAASDCMGCCSGTSAILIPPTSPRCR